MGGHGWRAQTAPVGRFVGLPLALVLAGAWAGGILTAWPPAADAAVVQHTAAELSGPAQVVVDRYGVPHVRAANPIDAAFLVGYEQARRRLFQMDLLRRLPAGTTHELLGAQAAPFDRQVRPLRLAEAAGESLSLLSRDTVAVLEAYAAGVNRWRDDAEASGSLPLEYGRVAGAVRRPVAWTPQDSLLVLKWISYQLSFRPALERSAILDAYARALGSSREQAMSVVFGDLWSTRPLFPAYIVPDAVGYVPLPEGEGHPPGNAAGLAAPGGGSAGPRPFGGQLVGVGPARSASGFPLLAVASHVEAVQPSPWLLQEVRSTDGRWVAAGFAVPGTPWVLLGFNDRVAWGFTAGAADVTDVYVERISRAADGSLQAEWQGSRLPLQAVGGDPQPTWEVSGRGPLLRWDTARGLGLSVQWTGSLPAADAEGVWQLNRASDLFAARRALAKLETLPADWVVVDVKGNVGYLTSGVVPLREDLEQGVVDGGPSMAPPLLRDGSGLHRHRWLPAAGGEDGDHARGGDAVASAGGAPGSPPSERFSVLPASEMPHVVNPASGWVVVAQNDPLGLPAGLGGLPLGRRRASGALYYFGDAFDGGARAAALEQALNERLRRRGRLQPEDLQALLQEDTTDPLAPRLVEALLQAWEAAGRPEAPEALRAVATPALQEAVELLRRWQFTYPSGVDPAGEATPGASAQMESAAATLYWVWVGSLVTGVVDGAVARLGGPASLPLPDGPHALAALVRALQPAGPSPAGRLFDLPDVDLPADVERDALLLTALRDALVRLRSPAFDATLRAAGRSGSLTALSQLRWGWLHALRLHHPLGRPFDLPAGAAVPVSGGFAARNGTEPDVRSLGPGAFTPARVAGAQLVVQLEPSGVQAWAALAGGQEGQMGRAHFADRLDDWAAGRWMPLAVGDGAIARQAAAAAEWWPVESPPPSPSPQEG